MPTLAVIHPEPLNDKAALLRPIEHEFLWDVYAESKKKNLQEEFIELLEEALKKRS